MNSICRTYKLLAGLLVAALGYLICDVSFFSIGDHEHNVAPILLEREPFSPFPAEIQHIDIGSFAAGGLRYRARADTIRITDRRIYVFSINKFKQLTVDNATIDIFITRLLAAKKATESSTDATKPSSDEVSSTMPKLQGILRLTRYIKGIERITRGVVNGLTLNLIRENATYMVVKAKKVLFNLRGTKPVLIGTSIAMPRQGTTIHCRVALWDRATRSFEIPGEYIAVTPAGKLVGRRITIDLNSRVKALH